LLDLKGKVSYFIAQAILEEADLRRRFESRNSTRYCA